MIDNMNAGITPHRFRDMVCAELLNGFGYTTGELRLACERHSDFIESRRRAGLSPADVASEIATADIGPSRSGKVDP
jgi:hypothetical protein